MSDTERNQFDEWRERSIAEHGHMPTEADAWQARAALAQQAVPEEFALVQVEPSKPAIKAIDVQAYMTEHGCGFTEAKAALYKAAPQAEQQADKSDFEIDRQFLRPEWIGPASHWDANALVVGLDCVRAALRAAQQAEREPVGWAHVFAGVVVRFLSTQREAESELARLNEEHPEDAHKRSIRPLAYADGNRAERDLLTAKAPAVVDGARVAAKWYLQARNRMNLAGEAIAISIGHEIDREAFIAGIKDRELAQSVTDWMRKIDLRNGDLATAGPTDRALMRQALEALEVAFDQTCATGRPKDWAQIKGAIEALREALGVSQPPVQPNGEADAAPQAEQQASRSAS